ncbi:AI-2E family transporter [Patescibacteria group bacterium]
MTTVHTSIKYLILAIFAFLFGLIVWPYLSSIVFALIFTISFYPLMKFFTQKLKIPKVISAVLVLLITLIFIFTPLALLIGLIAKEALAFVQTFDQEAFWEFFDNFSDFSIFGFTLDIDQIKDGLQSILQNAGNVIYGMTTNIGANVAQFIFLFFVFLFMYIFFLIDSEKLLKNLKRIAPFSANQNEKLFKKFKHVSKTVFVGNVISACLSGILAFIGFTFFNIPGALIWAILAALLSLIPTIGSFVVYALGAIIVYFLAGGYTALFVLAYYVVIEIIAIQSIIKPKLVDEKIAVHPVLVFLAIVGGINAFGSIGIIYGPLIVVLFVTMYEFIVVTQKKE